MTSGKDYLQAQYRFTRSGNIRPMARVTLQFRLVMLLIALLSILSGMGLAYFLF